MIRRLMLGIAAVAVGMVILSAYSAVALDTGMVGWVLAVVWAVGGLCIVGALWRGVVRQRN